MMFSSFVHWQEDREEQSKTIKIFDRENSKLVEKIAK